jgi:hypothetical protein
MQMLTISSSDWMFRFCSFLCSYTLSLLATWHTGRREAHTTPASNGRACCSTQHALVWHYRCHLRDWCYPEPTVARDVHHWRSVRLIRHFLHPCTSRYISHVCNLIYFSLDECDISFENTLICLSNSISRSRRHSRRSAHSHNRHPCPWCPEDGKA